MAKTHQNAEKFPIQWDGDVTQVGKDQQNDNIPSNVILSWGTADVTWGDVNFIQEIMDGIGSGSRRARQDRLNKLDDNKKKKLIHLICRIKGEKVYDDVTEVGSVEVKVDDVELVAETIIGKVKLEIKSGV
jgi:hypothetical protein|tara:strand:+ start:765 stop:1157 length:393 start_codon:yes stop_codon:yes gene_type:complete